MGGISGGTDEIQDKYPLALVTLKSPTDGATITDDMPTLAWSGPVLQTYKVQVAENSTLVQDTAVEGNQYTTFSLPFGTYYWRVKGTQSYQYETPWSLGWRFTVSVSIPSELIMVQISKRISLITPEAAVSVTLENTDAESVKIEVVRTVEDVGLTVQQLTNAPSSNGRAFRRHLRGV